jgi:hypothetical protein
VLNANDGLTSTDAVHEALALAGATGEHWSDAILHRMPRVRRLANHIGRGILIIEKRE